MGKLKVLKFLLNIDQQMFIKSLTLHNDDTVGGIGAESIGGDTLVLAGVGRLAVDDLNGDDTIGVGDGELVGL